VEARRRGLALVPPSSAAEEAGAGVCGHVAGRRVAIGSHAFLAGRTGLNDSARRIVGRADAGGGVGLFIGIDDMAAGAVLLSDPAREEAASALARLRAMGIERIAMVTGDRLDIARSIAAGLPIDAVIADTLPKDKVDAVLRERGRGAVVMVGDGVNDAPALAAADVGMAMGARGAAASAEAADVVLLVDDLTRVPDAVSIARRARRIALESVMVGLGLSFIGMVAAAFGYLPPLAGALTQEAIDVAVVLNALRALRWQPS
jgi:P-type E1-E2 ATPase